MSATRMTALPHRKRVNCTSPADLPLVRFVWHSGFMDAEAAGQIGKQIRIVLLEQTLRESHPELKEGRDIDGDNARLQNLY